MCGLVAMARADPDHRSTLVHRYPGSADVLIVLAGRYSVFTAAAAVARGFLSDRLALTLAVGILALVSPSPLVAAPKGRPPVMPTGVSKPSPQPKSPCPPGYTVMPTGVCKPSPRPKSPCQPGQTADKKGNCPRRGLTRATRARTALGALRRLESGRRW